MGQLAHFTAALALGYCGVFGGHATAQEAMPPVPGARPEAISIELSAAEDIGAACKLSFVVTNSHGQDIDKAVYEMVLFDAAGQVSRLTLLDFQDLPAGRLRVRQFQFPQPCADISRVLINGAQTCTAAGLDVGGCSQGLTLTSRTKMELLG
ncbi:hypothetical protein [Pseudophaeobacter arcticus]|jgi:hypothetical protein|uniref:hypothetical protein n=1 Tax=Pseudophaeobacter arcticus TaxID=385492 RepID=UPI0024935030|nr:hypothetical protein [Pseudophaeobacter arcticus]